MNQQIEKIKTTRQYLLNLLSELTVEQLNEIPAGFNNNIIWNIGHLVASQQGLCYLRAGVPLVIDEKYIEAYKPGSKPEHNIDANEVEILKGLLLSTIDQLDADYQRNHFTNYTPWTTRYGVEMKNIEDILAFIPFHEGMHLGYIMALRRLLKK